MTCAFAVRGAIKKLPGVDTVDVSLNKGMAAVKLKPGNTVTLQQLWGTIRSNGFTPKDAHVTAQGKLLKNGDRLELALHPDGKNYELIFPASSKESQQATSLVGKRVQLEGIVTPPKDLGSSAPIRVQSIGSGKE